MQIAVILMAVAAFLIVANVARATASRRYPARPASPYATFDGDDQAPEGPQLLECEGTCHGATVHESDGARTGTCITCGTPRTVLPTDAA